MQAASDVISDRSVTAMGPVTNDVISDSHGTGDSDFINVTNV